MAFDAAASSTGGGSPRQWNHTVAVQNDRLLVVGFVCSSGVGSSVTEVTYNSKPMTRVAFKVNGQHEASIWMLDNPDTGTNQVSVVFNGSSQSGAGVSVSYYAAQHIVKAINSAFLVTTGTGDKTFGVQVTKKNCWIFAVGHNSSTLTPTLVADQTSRGSVTFATASQNVMTVEDTNGVVTFPSNQMMGFTAGAASGSPDLTLLAVSFGEVGNEASFIKNNLRPRPFAPGIAR